tara:strand:- start:42 stop:290 length:249 start_codon:yes stop_codon:yes gene_type:complete
MALLTPLTYPNSVLVVADTAIFCDPLEITALFAVKDSVSIVVADPEMVPDGALVIEPIVSPQYASQCRICVPDSATAWIEDN